MIAHKKRQGLSIGGSVNITLRVKQLQDKNTENKSIPP